MSRTTTTRYAVGLTAGAALALAGCSSATPQPGTTSAGNTSATTAATPSSTATSATSTATGSATATASGIPEGAKVHSVAGAAAFVRHYFAQVNVAWTQPRTGLLPPLCLPSSKSCASTEQTAADLVQKSQHYSGDPVKVNTADDLGKDGAQQLILFTGTQEQRDIVDSSGRVVSTDSKKDLRRAFSLEWDSGMWKVATIKDYR